MNQPIEAGSGKIKKHIKSLSVKLDEKSLNVLKRKFRYHDLRAPQAPQYAIDFKEAKKSKLIHDLEKLRVNRCVFFRHVHRNEIAPIDVIVDQLFPGARHTRYFDDPIEHWNFIKIPNYPSIEMARLNFPHFPPKGEGVKKEYPIYSERDYLNGGSPSLKMGLHIVFKDVKQDKLTKLVRKPFRLGIFIPLWSYPIFSYHFSFVMKDFPRENAELSKKATGHIYQTKHYEAFKTSIFYQDSYFSEKTLTRSLTNLINRFEKFKKLYFPIDY